MGEVLLQVSAEPEPEVKVMDPEEDGEAAAEAVEKKMTADLKFHNKGVLHQQRRLPLSKLPTL
jgi:hypothetical protein